MELDFEKDVLKLMKLLAYKLKSAHYENYHIPNLEEHIGTPWIELTLKDGELADIGISKSQARLLQPAIYQKQGMNMGDFTIQEYFQDGVELPFEDAPISIHTLFWIDNIIKDLEDEKKKTVNPELVTKVFNDENSLTFNGLTGYFTYNQISGKITLNSRKFKLLRTLLHSEAGIITYEDMAQLFFKTKYNKANHTKGFSDALDDLKRDLGILPTTSSSNPNCFENITGTGYRLSLP